MKNFLHYQFIRKTNFLKWVYRAKIKNRDKYIIKNVQGSKMLLNTRDRGISYDLIIDGIREPNSTRFVNNLLKKGETVIDLGANIGYYVLMESKIIGNGKVYAIEPEIKNFNILKKNVKLNNRYNVEFMNAAVGDKNGFDYMNISSYSNMHTLYKNEDSKDYKYNRIIGKRKVRVITLDWFCKKHKITPNFVRMDVQGYEHHIIKGMKNLLKQKKPLRIFMELHPQMMTQEHTLSMLNMLKNNGFGIIKMFRDYNLANLKFKKNVEYDYSIDQLINDMSIISGSKGTFEIFFSNRH